jgi:hypothetical protein
MQIELTGREVELFDLLVASVEHKGASTTIRYAQSISLYFAEVIDAQHHEQGGWWLGER